MRIYTHFRPAKPPPPDTFYTLELDYSELHNLYHMMLDRSRLAGLGGDEQAFFNALKEHA